MKYLPDIKVIDLRYSEWDKEKSKPRAGRYVFTKKVYVSWGAEGRVPPWWFSWCRYDPRSNYRELMEWQADYNATPVVFNEDPYWPETIAVNTEGYYQNGDVVLVKSPLIEHLERRLEEKRLTEGGGYKKLQQFMQQVRHDAAKHGINPDTVSLPDDILNQLMS